MTSLTAQQWKPPPAYLTDILQPDQRKAVAAASGLFTNRRLAGAVANWEFYNGNHYQNGNGYIGAKPVSLISQVMRQIEQAFVSENVIKEVVDRHRSGILGREPLWGFVPSEMTPRAALSRRRRFARLIGAVVNYVVTGQTRAGIESLAQEADVALTVWWDQGQPKAKLKDALVRCLTEDRALLRFYVPRGLYKGAGGDNKGPRLIPEQPDLTSALKLLCIDVVSCDKGGVFTDSDTQRPFAIYVYRHEQSTCVELSYVNEAGQTVLQVLSDNPALAVEPIAYDLQGRLWMYEMQRPALITEQIRSAQKSLNLALTMLMRNVNLAGNLERTIMNAERPKRKITVSDGAGGYREEEIDSDWLTGPGVSNLLTGLLIRDDKGNIIDRADPNISYRNPVPIDTFVGTRGQYRECILGQAQQLHIMISGDSTVSGRSREQARAEYRGSLLDSKDPLDDAGRWVLEGGLRIAAQLCGRVGEFAALRCDFDARVEDGPVAADERSANREDVKAGLLSKESAMSRNGTEDTDAEFERIKQEREQAAELNPALPLTEKPLDGDSEVVQ